MTAVKKTAFLLLVLAFVAAGCKDRNARGHNAVKTETIAPAASQDPASSSTDSITTQTVDVEDSRSVAEGGDTASDETSTSAPASAKKKTVTSRKARPAGRTR